MQFWSGNREEKSMQWVAATFTGVKGGFVTNDRTAWKINLENALREENKAE